MSFSPQPVADLLAALQKALAALGARWFLVSELERVVAAARRLPPDALA